MPSADLLARLDRLLGELQALRDEIAAADPSDNCPEDIDDLSDGNLIDTHSAAERFNYDRHTLARWCREGCGVKRGGRWLVSIPRLQRRLNGGGTAKRYITSQDY
jgi:hypothetical protein